MFVSLYWIQMYICVWKIFYISETAINLFTLKKVIGVLISESYSRNKTFCLEYIKKTFIHTNLHFAHTELLERRVVSSYNTIFIKDPYLHVLWYEIQKKRFYNLCHIAYDDHFLVHLIQKDYFIDFLLRVSFAARMITFASQKLKKARLQHSYTLAGDRTELRVVKNGIELHSNAI